MARKVRTACILASALALCALAPLGSVAAQDSTASPPPEAAAKLLSPAPRVSSTGQCLYGISALDDVASGPVYVVYLDGSGRWSQLGT